ncbi:MAG: alpha/beta hydrolase [Clostridia bacterium]|nr:alpha/beta hydrolase [Clostridia bacterium]
MRRISNIQYSNHAKCNLDVLLPNSTSFDVLVYFHGGGLGSGDKSEGDVLADYLTKRGVAVVSADYRIYPDAKYPDYINDAASAVEWTCKNISKYGNCTGIYIAGTSAGAYISMMLCFNKAYFLSRGINPETIKGYIHDSGQPTCHFNVLNERGMDMRRIVVDDTAPMYYIGTEDIYPPMAFIVADHDMENRYEQIQLTVSTMKHFGHDTALEVLCGAHCEHVSKLDCNGESVFGKIIYKYITKWNTEKLN